MYYINFKTIYELILNRGFKSRFDNNELSVGLYNYSGLPSVNNTDLYIIYVSNNKSMYVYLTYEFIEVNLKNKITIFKREDLLELKNNTDLLFQYSITNSLPFDIMNDIDYIILLMDITEL